MEDGDSNLLPADEQHVSETGPCYNITLLTTVTKTTTKALSCAAEQEDSVCKIRANITVPAEIHPSGVFICRQVQISGAGTPLVLLCVSSHVQSALYDLHLHSECDMNCFSAVSEPDYTGWIVAGVLGLLLVVAVGVVLYMCKQKHRGEFESCVV